MGDKLTQYINNFMYFLEGNNLCSGMYCYLYWLIPPITIILLFSVFGGGYLKSAKKAGNFNKLNWQQMERAAKEYYKSKGFSVIVNGGAKADGGIDLIAKKNGKSILVQVKHYKGKVGVSIVREMLGVFIDEGKYSEVHIVTSSTFTKPALDLAKRHPIKLIGGFDLMN